MEFINLTEETIENSLLNAHQLVFEVTSTCNLSCYYCAYGSLYQKSQKITSQTKMSFEDAKIFIDYFVEIWTVKKIPTSPRTIYISFYGGEPLINFSLIQEIVLYCESLHIPNIHFTYSLTTNAILLDRYMAFLARYNFQTLISLDGNEQGQSYRIDKQARNSFPIVIKNIEVFQQEYPDYFQENVSFNAVIHDRNDLLTTYSFIKEKFGKEVMASSLSTSNIKTDKKEEFKKIYKEIDTTLDEYLKHENQFSNLSIMNYPSLFSLMTFIFNTSGNVYKTYNDLLVEVPERKYPTGTCVPFSKKIFLTVNKDILVCERISQNFVVGRIKENTVQIDIPELTRKYREYYEKIIKQCESCANNKNCISCIFQMDAFMETGKCPEWMSAKDYNIYSAKMKQLLLDYPEVYQKIINDIVISE